MTLSPYADARTIATAHARVDVSPQLGAAILRYDICRPQGLTPAFRPTGETVRDVFDCAMNILTPWANRVSGGGFGFDGRFHALPSNWPGEKCPLHGDGFQAQWQVSAQGVDHISLVMESDGPGPFRYKAELAYKLEDAALVSDLRITNTAECRLPYGGGFHPWFPRHEDTSVQARAGSVWLEDAGHLPGAHLPLSRRPDLDFARARSLPDHWINNCFEGWDGAAQIIWPRLDFALDIEADPPLSFFHIYAPGGGTEFFCFEPVSHVVDAHNLASPQAHGGLQVLAPGENMNLRCRFSPGRPFWRDVGVNKLGTDERG